MPLCNECGEEIIFRTLDGVRTPVHLSGFCRGYSSYSYGESLRTATYTYKRDDDFCRKTRCPECGEEVYFIRHNGGAFWVDELGWPWPKHACFDDASTTRALNKIEALMPRSSFFLLARIVAVHSLSKTTDKIIVVILEDGREGHFQVVCSSKTNLSKDDIVVVLNSSIIASDGERLPVFDFMFHGTILYKVYYCTPESAQINPSEQRDQKRGDVFGCPYCRSLFSNLDAATRHIYNNHKNMIKDISTKGRTQEWSLLRRKVTIQCRVCHKFFSRSELTTHTKEAHQK